VIKSSVILILKTFSDEEIKQFEDFLNSPFHNKNTKVLRLFNTLKEYHPGYNDDKLSKENLFKELFGNLKYKESYVRNLFSDLNILAEQYLQYVHITKNYTYEKFLIEELNIRDITELMDKKIRLFEKKINLEKSKDQDYYMNRLFIYNMKAALRTDKTLTESFLPDEILNKIKILLITVMESYFHLIIEEQRVKIRHNFVFLKHTLDYLKDHLDEFKDSPLLIIFYHLWLCFFDKNDEKYFLKTKKLFKTHFSSLTKLDKQNIYSVLQAYCMNKIDKGYESYNKELVNILLEILKFNAVSHKDDLIHLNLYRNILLVCCKLKEINLLKKFISDYIGFIRVESRKSMSAYSFAHLNFHQNNFEKALELCNEINFNDLLVSTNENLFFKNDIKKLVLMCLYELNSTESALSHVDAYKHFLKNSKVIKEDRRRKYNNFINLVNELIKLRINFDDFKFVEFKKKVQNTKELIGGAWVMEKISEMEKKF